MFRLVKDGKLRYVAIFSKTEITLPQSEFFSFHKKTTPEITRIY